MSSRFSSFPLLTPQGRRGSFLNVLRQATGSSKLSSVFSRKKKYITRSGQDSDDAAEQRALTQYSTELTVLNISSANLSAQEDETPFQSFENLDALGISFPRRGQDKRETFVLIDPPTLPSPDQDSPELDWYIPGSESNEFSTPDESTDHDSSTNEATPQSEAKVELAESSMTLIDSACGKEAKTVEDLAIIGDDVVLRCILNGMDDASPSNFVLAPESPQESGSAFLTPSGDHTPLQVDKALLELRHRKDPAYEAPPAISVIEATPTEMDKLQPRPYHARGGSFHPPLSRTPGALSRSPSTGSMRPSYCSRFVEPERIGAFNAPHKPTAVVMPGALYGWEDDPFTSPDEHPTEPSMISSFFRVATGRLHSVFRRGTAHAPSA